jgi:hypothetical protein
LIEHAWRNGTNANELQAGRQPHSNAESILRGEKPIQSQVEYV